MLPCANGGMAAMCSALDALEAWVESNSARADVLPEGREGLAQRVAEDLARGGE